MTAADALNLVIWIWAGMWITAASVLGYRARDCDRLRAAGWMISIAAFLAAQEDPGLLIYTASLTPFVDRDGVLGLVHPHMRGHMYSGAILAIGGLVVCASVAFTELRRGERSAWTALLVYLLQSATPSLSRQGNGPGRMQIPEQKLGLIGAHR